MVVGDGRFLMSEVPLQKVHPGFQNLDLSATACPIRAPGAPRVHFWYSILRRVANAMTALCFVGLAGVITALSEETIAPRAMSAPGTPLHHENVMPGVGCPA